MGGRQIGKNFTEIVGVVILTNFRTTQMDVCLSRIPRIYNQLKIGNEGKKTRKWIIDIKKKCFSFNKPLQMAFSFKKIVCEWDMNGVQ